jgi:hypothetical protein
MPNKNKNLLEDFNTIIIIIIIIIIIMQYFRLCTHISIFPDETPKQIVG